MSSKSKSKSKTTKDKAVEADTSVPSIELPVASKKTSSIVAGISSSNNNSNSSSSSNSNSNSNSNSKSSCEYDVHRLRIGDWIPSAIHSITRDPNSHLVAVGRVDGDIEIYDSSCKWHVLARVPGKSDLNLQALVWTRNSRLLGISLRGFLFEIDLSTLSYKNITDVYGGAAWSMSICPRSETVAVGCEDGSVKLFDLSDSSAIVYRKTFPTTGARVLSLCYHPSMARIFLGCADGTIRCLDEASGSTHFRMIGHLSNKISTYILALRVTSDSTVISGDNHGNVQIYDGNTGVQIISFRQHLAEIRSIAVSLDERHVFATGIDSKVISIRKVDGTSAGDSAQWVYTTSHRPHSLDVYSLEVVPSTAQTDSASVDEDGSSSTSSCLVSGGLDGKLCLYSIEDFAKVRPSWILSIPATGLMNSCIINTSKSSSSSSSNNSKSSKSSASGGSANKNSPSSVGLFSLKHRTHMDLWTANINNPDNSSSSSSNNSAIDKRPHAVIQPDTALQFSTQIKLKSQDHIHCSSLSNDGQYLAISSHSGTKVWRLNMVLDDKTGLSTVETHPLTLPSGLGSGTRGFAHAIAFSKDSRRLALYLSSGNLVLFDLSPKVDTVTKLMEVYHTSEVLRGEVGKIGGNFGAAALSISVGSLAFSADGQFLAVASALTEVYVYDVDSMRLHWRLPKASRPISCISFHPKNISCLSVLLSSNEVLLFNIETMQLSPFGANKGVPSDILNISAPLCGISYDKDDDNLMMLYGQSSVVCVDLSRSIPDKVKVINSNNSSASHVSHLSSRKRKRIAAESKEGNSAKVIKAEEEVNPNFAVATTYRSIIHLSCLDSHQMVVVENPWARQLERMPEALARKRYGT